MREPALPIRPRGVAWLGVLGALALVAAAAWLYRAPKAQRAGEEDTVVSASGAWLALAGKNDQRLEEVERATEPDLYFHVTLSNAPLGRRLALTCDWLDPAGQNVRQNHYETRPIESAVWNTRCHQRFGPSATAGSWTVRLVLGTRTLTTASFTLR